MLSAEEAKMIRRFNLKSATAGLLSTGIPIIFKGMVNQFLEDKQIGISQAVDWVTGKKDLLTLFKEYGGDNFENALERAGHFVHDTTWLTADYLIESCRDEHPDIASLFMGWVDARVWLEIQADRIRQEFNRINKLEAEEIPPTETPTDAVVPPTPVTSPTSTPDGLSASEDPKKKPILPKSFPSLV
jgi:hypothetical protein